MRKISHRLVAQSHQADPTQQCISLFNGLFEGGARLEQLVASITHLRRNPDVFMHAELLEDIGDLKSFGDAAPRIVVRL